MRDSNGNIFPHSDRWSYLWLVIGAVFMVFIAGNWPVSLAGWLAPLFLIRFMRTQKTIRGFFVLVVALSVSSSFAFQKGAGIDVIPLPIFSILIGFQFSLLFLIDRVLIPRFPKQGSTSFLATLVFPLLITAHEFLLFNKFFFGSSGSWAYTQHSNLILMQIVSITGLWGLTFLMGWFSSTLNWIWERKFSWQEVQRGVFIFGSIFLMVLIFGNVRLRFFTPEPGTVRIHGFISLEQDPEMFLAELMNLWDTDQEVFRQKTVSMYDTLINGSIHEAQAGAQIVVWPEVAAIGIKEDIDTLVARGQQVAQAENIYLAMGVWIFDQDNDEVRVLVADPTGEIVINHLKYAYGMGTPISEVELQVADTPYGRLSAVLCGDLDNPGVVSQAGQKGVDIMLVPGLENLEAMSQWHYRLAPFRAVENGFSLIRPTTGGVSIATDPFGRILTTMDFFSANDRVIVAQIPTKGVPTLYAAVGNLFGWLTVVGFVVLAVWAFLQGRQKTQSHAATSSDPLVQPK